MLNKKKKIDLFFGCFGNGTTVCDRNRQVHGDYLKIAHIIENGEISWYDYQLPEITKSAILFHAFEFYGKTQFVKEQLQLQYPNFSIHHIQKVKGANNQEREFTFLTNYPFDTNFQVKSFRHDSYPNYAGNKVYFTYTTNTFTI